MAPAALTPSRVASGTASAKTPIGAVRSTHCTRVSDASRIASKTRTTVARASPLRPAMARPKKSEKTMSGSIAPSAAARIGLFGTRPMSQSAKPGRRCMFSCVALTVLAALACSAAEAAGSMGRRARMGGARTPEKIPPATSVPT